MEADKQKIEITPARGAALAVGVVISPIVLLLFGMAFIVIAELFQIPVVYAFAVGSSFGMAMYLLTLYLVFNKFSFNSEDSK